MKSNPQSSDKKEKDTIETVISICNSNNTKYMNFLNVFGLDILDNKSLVEELRRKLYMHKTKTTHRTPRLQHNDEFATFLDQDNSEIVMKKLMLGYGLRTLSGKYGKSREEIIGIVKKCTNLLSLRNKNQLLSADMHLFIIIMLHFNSVIIRWIFIFLSHHLRFFISLFHFFIQSMIFILFLISLYGTLS